MRSTALFEIERRLTDALGWNETLQFAEAKESASALPCQTSEDYHHAARRPLGRLTRLAGIRDSASPLPGRNSRDQDHAARPPTLPADAVRRDQRFRVSPALLKFT